MDRNDNKLLQQEDTDYEKKMGHTASCRSLRHRRIKRLHFTARVYDDVTEIAAATHERYIVDNERFTRKANSKLTAQS